MPSAVVADLKKLPFIVIEGREDAAHASAPARPSRPARMQQEAAKKLGFSARRTMRAAQDLYEGIEIGEEGPIGLITYMRTDSVRVSDTAIEAVREFIAKNYAKPYLPETPESPIPPRRRAPRTRTRPSVPPTCVAGRSRCSSTWSRTSSGSTS